MNAGQNKYENFAISEGGLLNTCLEKLNLANSQKKLVAFGLAIVWLPLVLISIFEGAFISGVQIPFLFDAAMQARLLIAFPLLLLIKKSINNKVQHVSSHCIHELINAEDREQFIKNTLQRANTFIKSGISEFIMVLIVIGLTVSMVKSGIFAELEGGKTSWMASIIDGKRHLSMAGYWSVCVSIPVTQFLMLRWYWRYIVWALLLYRLSKTRLDLLPTHADKAGGLGIIVLAQRSFALFFMAVGVILSGQLIAMLLDAPETFNTIRTTGIGFILLGILTLILPLLFFVKKLYIIKSEGLLKLSKLSTGLSGKFEREWMNDAETDKILDKSEIDPSLIFDYGGMYSQLEEFRIVPVAIRDIVGMAAMLFIPFTPILFIQYSIVELMQKIAGMVI